LSRKPIPVTIIVMSIQVLIVGIHLARSTRGKPCAPPQAV
jgi:hypothetical protein